MGSIGLGEILLIVFIALLLFGPKRLPELGKALGKAIREFKKAENEVKNVFQNDFIEKEKKQLDEKEEKPQINSVDKNE